MKNKALIILVVGISVLYLLVLVIQTPLAILLTIAAIVFGIAHRITADRRQMLKLMKKFQYDTFGIEFPLRRKEYHFYDPESETHFTLKRKEKVLSITRTLWLTPHDSDKESEARKAELDQTMANITDKPITMDYTHKLSSISAEVLIELKKTTNINTILSIRQILSAEQEKDYDGIYYIKDKQTDITFYGEFYRGNVINAIIVTAGHWEIYTEEDYWDIEEISSTMADYIMGWPYFWDKDTTILIPKEEFYGQWTNAISRQDATTAKHLFEMKAMNFFTKQESDDSAGTVQDEKDLKAAASAIPLPEIKGMLHSSDELIRFFAAKELLASQEDSEAISCLKELADSTIKSIQVYYAAKLLQQHKKNDDTEL